jgi:hypothetical protein
MKYCLIGLTLLVSASVSSHANVDGETLSRYCAEYKHVQSREHTTEEQFAQGSFCIGYIRGVTDTMITWKEVDIARKATGAGPDHPCIPQSASVDELVRVAVKYLDDHPEDLHLPAESLVFGAMRKAFPCH